MIVGCIHSLQGFFSGMFISEPLEAMMCGVKATDRNIDWYASDFAQRFGDMLREGRSIREAADELMNPVWVVNELTEYNYSRLVYLDEEYSETADMPQSIYMVRVK